MPLAARGPWIVTAHGAVVYDAGGYGMTGFGHSPDDLLNAVSRPEVMANVMTGSFAQADLTHALRREIGRNWTGARGRMMVTNEKDAEDDDAAWTNQLEHPYASFACLNSGTAVARWLSADRPRRPRAEEPLLANTARRRCSSP